MGRVREMFRGMAIGRAVATADMATSQTETKMNPGRSNFQAFFTACSASSHGLNRSRVWTGHESPPGLKNNHTRVSFLYDRNPRVFQSPLWYTVSMTSVVFFVHWVMMRPPHSHPVCHRYECLYVRCII